MDSPINPLPRRCGCCGKTRNLSLCYQCQATSYCSIQHDKSRSLEHRGICKVIWQQRFSCRSLEDEYLSLTREPPDPAIPDWKTVHAERIFDAVEKYIFAVWDQVQSLERMKTRESVIIRSDLLAECRSLLGRGLTPRIARLQNHFPHDCEPGLWLQLGEDVKAYQHCETKLLQLNRAERILLLNTCGFAPGHHADVPKGKHVEYAKVFQNEADNLGYKNFPFTRLTPEMAKLVSFVLLIKIKMLLDLKDLTASRVLYSKSKPIPHELISIIQTHLVRSQLISRNRHIMFGDGANSAIPALETQIKSLSQALHRYDRYFAADMADRAKTRLVNGQRIGNLDWPERRDTRYRHSIDCWKLFPEAVDYLKKINPRIFPKYFASESGDSCYGDFV